MSDPVITTARVALQDRLQTIRIANGYRTTVAAVRWSLEARVGDTRDDFPVISLFSLDDRRTGDTIGNVLQLTQDWERTIQLEAILLAEDEYENQWDALLADILHALSLPIAPAPLNSAALDLSVRTVEFTAPAAGSQYAVMRMQLVLSYRVVLE